MIRKTWQPDKWLLISQVEHARVAGLMAASWNFPGRKPHRDVIHAIAQHEAGWRGFDESPALNAAGDPLDHTEAAPDIVAPLWTASTRHLEGEDKQYGARVVGAYYTRMARDNQNLARLSTRSVVAIGRFIGAESVALQRFLAAAARNGTMNEASTVFEDSPAAAAEPAGHADPLANLADDLRLLQVCDTLSLLLCSDFTGEAVIRDVPYMAEGDTLTVTRGGDGKMAMTISPLPFRKNLRDHVTGVPVPRRAYASQDELCELHASAKPLVVEWHIGTPG